MKKTNRHHAILTLIAQQAVETQEELANLLRQNGYDVTQATVSRDIKELKLAKIQDGTVSKYVAMESDNRTIASQKYRSILKDTVVSVDNAMNLAVIKCHVGMANAACVALDLVHSNRAVGTIAGDDTIFVAFRSVEDATAYAEELKNNL